MMFNLNDLALNVSAAEDGAWFKFHNDVQFKIAKAGCDRYTQALQKAYTEILADGKNVTTDNNKYLEQMGTIACLTDWKGVSLDGKKALKFTQKNAEKLFLDPKFKELYTFLSAQANTESKYREGVAAAKKS